MTLEIAGDEITLMYRWFEDHGYAVDVVTLRKRYPDLVSVKEFLAKLAALPTDVVSKE